MTTRDHADLARRKTDKTSGGDVNYYLVDIVGARFGVPCVVEVEDIIEALDMRFAEANVFKAMVRSAKLRQDLGKPGSSKRYEAEKGIYYSDRSVAKAERRQRRDGGVGDNLFGLDLMIDVPEPKRLAPYAVHVEDFIDALHPTEGEAETLRAILTLCLTGIQFDAPTAETRLAREASAAARRVMAEVEA